MTRLALLLLLCLCGCVRVPVVPPGPGPEPTAEATIDSMAETFAVLYRRTCRDAAEKLRSGGWNTDRQYLDGHRLLIKDALESAGQPLAERQQAETTPFTPAGMAAWLEAVAREGEQ